MKSDINKQNGMLYSLYQIAVEKMMVAFQGKNTGTLAVRIP